MENTKVFKKYHHIVQFNQILVAIRESVTFAGLDDAGNPTWDNTRELPKLKFTGTVKLYGTNSSVVFDPANDDIYAQSRNRVLTVDEDHHGFAKWVENNKEYFKIWMNKVWVDYAHKLGVSREDGLLVIYGEWCGEEIQNNSPMRNLPKTFVLFSVQICSKENPPKIQGHMPDRSFRYELPEVLKGNDLRNHHIRLYTVHDFKTFEVEVDCNKPEYARQKMVELTNEVEEQCPVMGYFGVKGPGEGIVWSCHDYPKNNHPKYKNGAPYVFKVKGKEHSVTKVKTLTPVDIERLENTSAFLEYALTENRMKQAIEYLNEMGLPAAVESMGDFIRWCADDILREEQETIEKSGLNNKEITKQLSNRARKWFFKYLKEQEKQ